MKKKILIVTSKEDEHANYIIAKCNHTALKDCIVRLNTEDIIENFRASFDGTTFWAVILDSQKHFSDKEVKTVWYRRPVKAKGTYNDDGVNRFLVSQYETFLQGLYYCTHESALWINDLRANLFARNKLFQLKLAREIGMNVPDTLVTNNAKQAIEFSQKHLALCNKSLTVPRYAIGGVSYPYMTRVIDAAEISNHSDSVNQCPTLFQKYIDKKLDLRVVVLRDQLFAFEIESQSNDYSKIDVRGVDPAKLTHRHVCLPDELQSQILKFVQMQGLVFSSMDFVLTESNKYYFIENNCNGQWLWLEYLTGVPMSDTFIDLFFNNTL